MQSKQRKNSDPSSNSRVMPPVASGSDDHILEMPPPMGTSSSQASQGSLDIVDAGARRRKTAGLTAAARRDGRLIGLYPLAGATVEDATARLLAGDGVGNL